MKNRKSQTSAYITAIAINTIGAGLILVSGELSNRFVAIATMSVGYGVAMLGITKTIAQDHQDHRELLETRKEAVYWAQEAQKHFQDKRELLDKFQDLDQRIRKHEEEYAIAIAFLEAETDIDETLLEKMAKAELN